MADLADRDEDRKQTYFWPFSLILFSFCAWARPFSMSSTSLCSCFGRTVCAESWPCPLEMAQARSHIQLTMHLHHLLFHRWWGCTRIWCPLFGTRHPRSAGMPPPLTKAGTGTQPCRSPNHRAARRGLAPHRHHMTLEWPCRPCWRASLPARCRCPGWSGHRCIQ